MEVLSGAPDLAHVSRHPHAAHDGAGKQTLADGTGTSSPSLGAVGRVAAAEIMTFHHTLKAATLGDADGIDKIALGENAGADDVAGFDGKGEIAEFAHTLRRRRAKFLEMSQQGFDDAMFLLIIEAQLDGVVAVRFSSFRLDDAIGPSQDNCHRHENAMSIIDARLAKFFS